MSAAIRLQSQYATTTELNRQLVALEKSINEAFIRCDSLYAARWNVTPVQHDSYRAEMDDCVLCDPSAAGFAVNLPSPVKQQTGRGVLVKNTTASTNTITVQAAGDITIDGAGSATITTAYGALRLIWAGNAWWTH